MFKHSKSTYVAAFVGLAVCAVLVASIKPRGAEASDPMLQATLSVPPRVTLPTVAPKAPKAPKAVAPPLGAAGSFSVLAASAVTNLGPTILNGDLGISPNNAGSITGFPPGVVVGIVHAADGVANQAQVDTTTAYTALAIQPCDFNLTGQDLGGLTLTPGVYCFNSSAQLTGALTLNALGDPTSIWVFRIGSTLTTASASSVLLINGASPCNVFWQVGSSATFGTTTAFKGNILAAVSITVNTGTNVIGRALARNGAVTMDTNNFSFAVCPVAPVATATPTPLPATQTAVVATLTAIPGTQTAIAATLAPSLTAIAATLAPSLTAIAATRTALAPTQTAIAATVAPSQTALSATQTATAIAARTPVPSTPKEVPEGDTLLLFGGGIGGLATWVGWQWRKTRARSKR